jgi:hypothetical protein
MLFQMLQFLFGSILLFDVPKDLSDVFFKRAIIGKHSLDYIPSYSNNSPFNILIVHKIVDISLDLIKSYTIEVADNIYYFG